MPETRRQGQEEPAAGFFRTALQSIAIFMAVQFVLGKFTGGANNSASKSAANAQVPAFAERPSLQDLDGTYSAIPQLVAPIWPQDTSLDISMYVSPSAIMPPLKSLKHGSLILQEKAIKLDNWTATREIHARFKVPNAVQHNGTLFGHIYVAQSSHSLDPTAATYDPSKAYHFVRPLNQYFKKKRVIKTRKLLSNTDQVEEVGAEEEQSTDGSTIASYYHPNFTMSLIPDAAVQAYTQLHPAVRQWVQLESTGARDTTGQNGWYYPIVFLNDFWQLRSHMTELNDTVTELPINIHLNALSFWKFNLLTTWDYGMKENAKAAANGNPGLTGSSDGSEFEQIKQILLDSNIYLLCTTAVVSVLHMILEMLAFKNDVSHWRNKKDNVGVSVRTILANVVMQSIIFLYLMDNNENTSWMILLSQGMGILLEAWKITKTVNVRIRPTGPGSRNPLPYSIIFEDKHKLSETERKTQEADQAAFRYLYAIGVPLLLAYAGYSLYYETHKSWYSFIIATLVGSVYAYGFLMMVPSLYINYKLKSVAHMPGKAMMYKTLNTFIDDLFAFTIKMPTLHRLATFRDDIIFFIYLYQSYKYKVDYSRVNEFGQGGEDEVPVVADKDATPKARQMADSDAQAVDGNELNAADTSGSSNTVANAALATGRADTGGRKRK